MEISRRPVSFLASVTSESEARLCSSLGADIIDAKNPAAGALGALPPERVRAIKAAVPGHVPVSATIGDPCDDAERVACAVRVTAATGVDIVKIGFWPGAGAEPVVRRLARLALGRVRLVAVLLCDRGLDVGLMTPLREAGFAGVMLDTSDKRKGPLPELVAPADLEAFVAGARSAGLFAGFAGSLRVAHVADLLRFEPDVLGFRGGLCRDGARSAAIDADAVRAVRRAVPAGSALAACGTRPGGAMARLHSEQAL